MARLKAKATVIISRDDALHHMEELNNIDKVLLKLDLDEAKAIQTVKEKYNKKRVEKNVTALMNQKKMLIVQLIVWAKNSYLGWTKKTLKTAFGDIGVRTATPSVVLVKSVAKNNKEAMALVISQGKKSFIRTIEELDKEAILKRFKDKSINNVELKSMGLKVKQTDDGWIESAESVKIEKALKELVK